MSNSVWLHEHQRQLRPPADRKRRNRVIRDVYERASISSTPLKCMAPSMRNWWEALASVRDKVKIATVFQDRRHYWVGQPAGASAGSSRNRSNASRPTASSILPAPRRPNRADRRRRGTVKDLIKAGKVLHFGLSGRARRPFAARTAFSRLPPSRPNTRSSKEARNTTACFQPVRSLESASFRGDQWDKASCPGRWK